MTNRKKRVERRVESTKEQIEKHKKKRDMAEEAGDEELVRYYNKEIKGMESQVEKGEEILEK
ncbi:MAG: hypothetical protein KKE23_01380 [Nanoarchaeota archaeon]|nr:hypothetical protein [Nanoarchaeota archaeon]